MLREGEEVMIDPIAEGYDVICCRECGTPSLSLQNTGLLLPYPVYLYIRPEGSLLAEFYLGLHESLSSEEQSKRVRRYGEVMHVVQSQNA